jgi:nucleoside-diphosphate-sugar epimerase
MAVYRFVRSIAEGLPITLLGDGGERDFTHVEDVARGVAAALKPLGYEIINLGSDRPAQISLVISIIEEALGKKATIDRQPRPATDPDTTWADISKAERLLDWRPQISLEEGLHGAVEWYLEHRPWAKEMIA